MLSEREELQRALDYARAHGVIVPEWVGDLAKRHGLSMDGIQVMRKIPTATGAVK